MLSIKDAGAWTDPCTLLSVPEELGPPSFAVDTLSRGHLVYKVHFCDQNGNSAIYYGTFNTGAPSLQTRVLDSSELSCGNASIDCTPYLNSVHAVWDKESKIWYNWKDSTGCHTPEDVSAEEKDASKTPSVDVVYDTVHVIWAFEIEPKKDIIRYRRKDREWGDISSPSDTNLETARQPVLSHGPGGLYAVWAEVPTGGTHSDILYAEWDNGEWQRKGNYCTSPVTDDYPQALQRPRGSNADIDVVWANGNSTPFWLANIRIELGRMCGVGPQSAGLRDGQPEVFALLDPFPSPFSESVVLRYHVPRPAPVAIRIFDVAGRLVSTLVDGHEKPGRYVAEWNGMDNLGRHVSQGVYFARMESGVFTATQKTILLR